MTSVRLLVTEKCNRSCSYCANAGLPKLKAVSLETLKDYHKIVITGGEPMLVPEKVLELCQALDDKELYLYTQFESAEYMPKILPYLLGITFTIHAMDLRTARAFVRLKHQTRNYPHLNKRLTVMPGMTTGAHDLSGWTVEHHELKYGECEYPEDRMYKLEDT